MVDLSSLRITLGAKKAPALGVFEAAAPRANLLPQASRDRGRRRRARRTWLAVSSAVVVITLASYAAGWANTGKVNAQLADLADQRTHLTHQLSVYSPVSNVASQTSSLTDTVASQTAQEVSHGAVLNEFVQTVGDIGVITTVTLTTTGDLSGCAQTNPFTTTPLAGCLTFSVQSAMGQAAAPELLTRLAGSPTFTNPFIPTVSTGNTGSTTLTGTVGVTQRAYTNAGSPAPTANPTDGNKP